MKNSKIIIQLSLLFLILTITSSHSQVQEYPNGEIPFRFISIIKCETPPVIDGILDDDCWLNADEAADFYLLHEEGPAEYQTIAYATYDDENIYIGFNCDEPDTGALVTDETEHDQQECDDDCVEVFLDVNQDYINYFHFIVNSKGMTSDASVELVDDFIDVYYDWDPEYEVQTSIVDGLWFVEMAIPFTELMTGIVRPSVFEERKESEWSAFSLLEPPFVTNDTVWNVNFTRRKWTEPNELSSWAPVCDKFYSPYQFGHLIFNEGEWLRGIPIRDAVKYIHRQDVEEKNTLEQNRLMPIIEEISSYIPDCNWVEVYRRNMFMGYESEAGSIQIPNYARLDGQGRIELEETIPLLPDEILDEIIAKDTPRLVFDNDSLAELIEKIDTDPNVEAKWVEFKEKADELLEEEVVDFLVNDMQQDRNCISREHAIAVAAGYGSLGTIRAKCAFAYAITGDVRYAEQAWRAQSMLIDHFEKYQVFRSAENWYSIWDSSYEVYSSTYFYDLVAGSGVMTRDDKVRLIEFIRRIGYRVDYCVRYSEMVGNHQYMWTGNFGCMELYFPEFPERERWASDVENRMPMLYADILTDGGQIERSPGHHIYGLSFLCKYVIATKLLTGEDIFSREYDGKSLEMTLDWIAKIATPLGETPAFNDSKRPMIESHEFVLDIINMFDRGDYLCAGKIDTANLPLEHLISDTVQPRDPDFTSALLPDTGIAIMRDSWDEDSKYLLFDYGPHGAWHGHWDKMNIIMYADGVPWVLDAGSSPHYCVYIEEHNNWHKQTIAHNTVMIDNTSQESVTGTLRIWETQDDFDLVSASHIGYEGIIHTRTVFHPRGEYFIINDHIESYDSMEHDYSWLLHVYAEPVYFNLEGGDFRQDGNGLLVITAEDSGFTSVDLEEGLCIDTTFGQTEQARDDGTWTPGDPGWAYIPYISLNSSTDAEEVNFLVILYPYTGETYPYYMCIKNTNRENNACGFSLVYEISHDTYGEDIYGEKKPGVDSSMEIELDGIRTDADYFFIRLIDGEIVQAIMVDGTYMFWNGIEIEADIY